ERSSTSAATHRSSEHRCLEQSERATRLRQPSFLCLTSKMSHDHSRHDSCRLPLYSRWIHSIPLSLARGMTAVVVGSGALLGLFHTPIEFPRTSLRPRARRIGGLLGGQFTVDSRPGTSRVF